MSHKDALDVNTTGPTLQGHLSLRSEVLGIAITMGLLATLACSVQVYTKLRIVKKFGFEDYLIIIGWILFAAGYQPITYLMTKMNSVGERDWIIPPKELSSIIYYMHVAFILYGLTILFIKASIITQCLHILPPLGVRGAAFVIFHFLLWAHVVVYITNSFIEIFICSPRAKAWDYTIMSGKCMDIDTVHVASSAVNTASDFILVIIPQAIVWRLHMPIRKLLAVSSVFLVGLLACVAAVMRMYYTIELTHNRNDTRTAITLGDWVQVEIASGFLVACMPSIPRFVKHQLTPGFLCGTRRGGLGNVANTILENKGIPSPEANAIITDVEFEVLVCQSNLEVCNECVKTV